MPRLAGLGFLLAIATLLVGALTSSAHAYLDPGTGSIILQVLLGGAAGLALVCKLYWQKFVSMFGLKRRAADLREIPQDRS